MTFKQLVVTSVHMQILGKLSEPNHLHYYFILLHCLKSDTVITYEKEVSMLPFPH